MGSRDVITEGCVIACTGLGFVLGYPWHGAALGIGLQTGYRRGVRDAIDRSTYGSENHSEAEESDLHHRAYKRSLIYAGVAVAAKITERIFWDNEVSVLDFVYDFSVLAMGVVADYASNHINRGLAERPPVTTHYVRNATSVPHPKSQIHTIADVTPRNNDDSGCWHI